VVKSKRADPEPTTSLRALILEPSLELALQVHSVLTSLTTGLPLKIHLMTAGFGVEIEKDVDILVSTPGSLKHFGLSSLFGTLEHIVLDEADALLDGGTKKNVYNILRAVNDVKVARDNGEKDPRPLQFIFSAATLPYTALKSPLMFIEDHYPGMEKISTLGVHKPVVTLKQHFIEPQGSQKLTSLIKLLNESGRKKTLIFVRTLEQAKNLGDLLVRLPLFPLPGPCKLTGSLAFT